MAFPIFINLRTGIDNGKVRFKIHEFFGRGRTNKHVGDKVLMPCIFCDKSNFTTTSRRGTAVSIKDIDSLSGIHVRDRVGIEFVKDCRVGRHVDIVPIDIGGSLRTLVFDTESILGRTTSASASIDLKGGTIFGGGHDSFLVLLFVFKEFWIAEILVNRGRTCNTKRSNTGLETSVCTSKRLDILYW
jgi:hypothetical protein